MVDENVPAPAPTRFDDQILLIVAWVPIGKSNYVLDLQKKQKNPIFQISVDILQNINFFRAFTASASVPAIYIQQFWNTLTYEAKTRAYSFQLDETRFVLDVNLLRKALEITSIDQARQFVSPLSGDAIMDFVNELGYTKVIHFVLRMEVNNLYQPWRAILSMINQCLTGKTSRHDRIFTSHSDFLTDKANLGSPTKKGKKDKPHVIPYCRFTKLIICYLGRIHNIHQRSASLFHLAEEDLGLGNLKFVSKSEVDEVFGMPIPNELISNNIRNASYYNAYLEMVAKHDRKIASIGPSSQPQDDTFANIVRDSLSPADAETGVELDKTNSEGDTKILHIAEELGDDMDKQVNLEEKIVELDQDQVGSNPGETHESRPPPEQVLMDEDQARPDPGEIRVALAGPDPEPTYDEFMANVYPNVPESLKFPADEHVILEEPLSSSRTLSSMKNLDDAYTIRDQFINDKATEDEPEKLNVESEVVSMVTIPIHQASASVPPTITTTTTTLTPHPQQQSTIESELAEHVTTLEKKFSDLEQKNKNLDNTTRNLGSRVFTLELRDLPYTIDETVRKTVKDVVQVALQSGTYKLLPEHVALYEALEASMAQAQRDEFLVEKDKSCKRCCDDQDPPLPPPDSAQQKETT
ncbi:hypothetical protein Tco_0180686 [Tanacetum coccineum]